MTKKILNKPVNSYIQEVTIVRYKDIPAINSVVVNGIEHDLGILKDFKKNPHLASFIPTLAHLSLSWVKLQKGRTLDIHEHPIDSMVVVTYGEVQLIGDKTSILSQGDIVAIPKNCKHGFVGIGADGFCGLSIQFEDRGLYEDVDSPLVEFINNSNTMYFDKLLNENIRFVEEFNNNSLFKLMRSGIFQDINFKNKFFDYFQIFSNYFQRMLMNRVCFTDNETYLPVFELHLKEEFGHHTKLKEDRDREQLLWDPILEATSSWFAAKMLTLDNLEKIILVNLVIETSACTFYANTRDNLIVDLQNSKHFDIHMTNIDHAHANLGIEFIQNAKASDFLQFFTLQKQGWDMLNMVFNRIAELVIKN